jgi:hypothetical protein
MTVYDYLVSRLRISGVVPLVPLYAFVTWTRKVTVVLLNLLLQFEGVSRIKYNLILYVSIQYLCKLDFRYVMNCMLDFKFLSQRTHLRHDKERSVNAVRK